MRAEKQVKDGLRTLRAVAVKYSSPRREEVVVGGRFPGFTRGTLANNHATYAYASATAPSLQIDGNLSRIASLNNAFVQMFCGCTI